MYRLQQQQFLSGGARVERSALGGSSLTRPSPSTPPPLRFFKRTSGSYKTLEGLGIEHSGLQTFPSTRRRRRNQPSILKLIEV
jgi:hypothetical protein